MSKLFTFILVIITIVSVFLIGFAGFVLLSAFQDDATPAIVEDPIDEETQTAGENQTNGNDSLNTADNSPLMQLSNALIEPAMILLTYHHIDPDLKGNPITVTPERFHEHINALQKSQYKPVSYQDITRFLLIAEKTRRLVSQSRSLTPTEEAWIAESLPFVKQLPKEGFHITFDDGYQSFYTYALPTLRSAQVPSTFFVIVRSSNKESQTAPDWINYPHVTWEELKTIQRYPMFEVQSHTYSLHSYEPGLSKTIPSLTGRIYRSDLGRTETQEEFETRVYQDMILSKSYLENRLRPHKANGLSYPYGAYNDTVIEMAEKAGLQFLFTNQSGLVTYSSSPMQIPRVNAGAPEITATDLMNIVDDLFFRQSFQNN